MNKSIVSPKYWLFLCLFILTTSFVFSQAPQTKPVTTKVTELSKVQDELKLAKLNLTKREDQIKQLEAAVGYDKLEIARYKQWWTQEKERADSLELRFHKLNVSYQELENEAKSQYSNDDVVIFGFLVGVSTVVLWNIMTAK